MIDRDLMISLRAQVNAALAEIAKKNGVTMILGNGKFDKLTAEFKLAIASVPSNGLDNRQNLNLVRELKAAETMKTQGRRFGLGGHAIGREVKIGGKPFVVKGLLTQRSKYNILAYSVNENKEVLITHTAVVEALEKARIAAALA